MSMDSYKEFLDLPSPNPEENKILIAQAVYGGPEEKWNLVLRNIRLVYSIVKRHVWTLSEQDEMFSDGIMGLYKASCNLKLCSSKQFTTYGGAYISQSIERRFSARRSSFNALARKTIGKPQYIDKPIDISASDNMEIKDVESVLPNEELEFKDIVDFSKKILISIYQSNQVGLTLSEKRVLGSLISNDLCISASAKELKRTRQNIHVIYKRIQAKIRPYLQEKFGKEMEDIYGEEGRTLNLRLYDDSGHATLKFNHFVHNVDDASAELRRKDEKTCGKAHKKYNSYSRCNKNKKQVIQDLSQYQKDITESVAVEIELQKKKRATQILELESKLSETKNKFDGDK